MQYDYAKPPSPYAFEHEYGIHLVCFLSLPIAAICFLVSPMYCACIECFMGLHYRVVIYAHNIFYCMNRFNCYSQYTKSVIITVSEKNCFPKNWIKNDLKGFFMVKSTHSLCQLPIDISYMHLLCLIHSL